VKIVKKLLSEGLSKQEVFEKASSDGLNLKKVAKQLSIYPDDRESNKYNKANNILIGLYSLIVAIGLIGFIPMLTEFQAVGMVLVLSFALLIPGAIIYCIYKKQSLGYLILCFFLFKGVLDSFKGIETDPLAVWVGVSINVCLIIYIVVLKNKLFPHQNFFNTKKDNNGFVVFTKI